MTVLVLDASVAFPWVRGGARAISISDALVGFDLMAPDFLPVEIANAAWKEWRFAGLPDTAAREIRAAFAELPVELVPSPPLIEPAALLAHRIKHPVYDCLYLALAVELDCAMLTADARFATAAAAHPDLAVRVRVLAA